MVFFFFRIQSGSEWIALCSKNILAEDIELQQQLPHLIFEDQTRLYTNVIEQTHTDIVCGTILGAA